ncbi:Transcription factor PAP1 [Teratosphaeria destructans]|uniref:Transcription factor PAP1 n=1 Tax=Teratosphaeria destructans TaxID=418781 RepID=A0A9W7SYG6_9PEZI|nr:Transcription factor PAP1 [Teratosphaeria destructans]
MESLGYDFFTSTPPQSHPYLGFGAGYSLLPSVGSAHPDGILAPEHSDTRQDGPAMDMLKSPRYPLSPHALTASNFDLIFDSPFEHNAMLTPLSSSSGSPTTQVLFNGSEDTGIALDLEHEPQRRRRSSSEEKDILTPAQSRRKAQNRAAQRAFRERKERHFRDLETKLHLLTTTTSTLQSDNERLKLMLQQVQTENEILRATASMPSASGRPPVFVDGLDLQPRPQSRNKAESRVEITHSRESSITSTYTSPAGSGGPPHFLSVSETWNLLRSNPVYLSGALDIGQVCKRLKRLARCDEAEPMFEEEGVRRIIEEVGRRECDE